MSDPHCAVSNLRAERDAALARAEKAEAERDAAQADLRERILRAAAHAVEKRQAEAEVSRLTALIDEAREAIEPFAAIDVPPQDGFLPYLRADLIRARAILPRLTKEPSHAE